MILHSLSIWNFYFSASSGGSDKYELEPVVFLAVWENLKHGKIESARFWERLNYFDMKKHGFERGFKSQHLIVKVHLFL